MSEAVDDIVIVQSTREERNLYFGCKASSNLVLSLKEEFYVINYHVHWDVLACASGFDESMRVFYRSPRTYRSLNSKYG